MRVGYKYHKINCQSCQSQLVKFFVEKLLGHSSMKITQDSYGKVVQKKISLEMNRLKGSG